MCLFRRDPGEECSLFRGDGRPSVSLWLLLLLLLMFRPGCIRVGVAIQDELLRWNSLHFLHLVLFMLSKVVLWSHFAMIAASLILKLIQILSVVASLRRTGNENMRLMSFGARGKYWPRWRWLGRKEHQYPQLC